MLLADAHMPTTAVALRQALEKLATRRRSRHERISVGKVLLGDAISQPPLQLPSVFDRYLAEGIDGREYHHRCQRYAHGPQTLWPSCAWPWTMAAFPPSFTEAAPTSAVAAGKEHFAHL